MMGNCLSKKRKTDSVVANGPDHPAQEQVDAGNHVTSHEIQEAIALGIYTFLFSHFLFSPLCCIFDVCIFFTIYKIASSNVQLHVWYVSFC